MPMILRIVAKGILSSKGFEIIEKILDRTHGRPMSQHEEERNSPPTITGVTINIIKTPDSALS